MAEQELSLLITLKDQVTAQLRQMNAEIKANTETWKSSFGAIQGQLQSAGIMLAGFGAAITGAFGLAYRAAEEDRLANSRLSISLRNIGVDFDNVKDSLDKYTEATAKSTAVSKSEQIGALNQLVLTTGDYNKALQILPIALDLAAAKQMDVQSAALLLGRVAEGNINALNRYGFSMDGVKSAGEALNIIQSKITGSAQAMVSPWKLLQTQLRELASDIGGLVAGPFGAILKKATEIIEKIREWAIEHPKLAKLLADLAVSLGIAAVAVGGLAIAVVGLGVALAFLGGPVTLALLGLFLLIAAATFLILKWDWVKEHWRKIWEVIATVLNVAMGPLGAAIGYLASLAGPVMDHWDSARGFWENIWNAMKIVVVTVINDIIGAIEWMINTGAKLFDLFVNKVVLGPIEWMANGVLAGVEKMINGVIKLLNIIPGVNLSEIHLPRVDLPRLNLEVNLPRLSEDIWGIFGKPYGPPAPPPGWMPPNIGTSMPPIPSFGNYGGLGQTFITDSGNITINVEGSVLTDQDLMNLIRQELLKLQTRVPTTGIK